METVIPIFELAFLALFVLLYLLAPLLSYRRGRASERWSLLAFIWVLALSGVLFLLMKFQTGFYVDSIAFWCVVVALLFEVIHRVGEALVPNEFVSEEESSDEWLVNFEYADNFLTRVAVPYEGMDASYGLEFGWENGNIVRVGSYDEYVKGSKKSPAQNRRNGKTDLGTAMTRLMFPLCGILSSSDRGHGSTKKSVDWYADYHMEYTSHENKSNVDIASLAWTILGGIVDPSQFVGVFGFTGTMSKNLPESLYEDDEYEPDGRWDYGRVEYVLDADGLMEKVTVFDEEGNRVGTISFEY